MSFLNKAIFLDRDGVINEPVILNGKPYPPATVNELKLFDGVAESLLALREAGYLLIVVTNQPDVARGKTPMRVVNEINNYLMSNLPLDAIHVCFHDDSDQCNCRKPLPGLLLNAAKEFNIELSESYMVGDRWKDIAAGQAAGCKTVWIDACYDEKKPVNPDITVSSLWEASKIILNT